MGGNNTHFNFVGLGWSGDIENDISDNGSGNAHLPYTNFGYNGFTATPNTKLTIDIFGVLMEKVTLLERYCDKIHIERWLHFC